MLLNPRLKYLDPTLKIVFNSNFWFGDPSLRIYTRIASQIGLYNVLSLPHYYNHNNNVIELANRMYDLGSM